MSGRMIDGMKAIAICVQFYKIEIVCKVCIHLLFLLTLLQTIYVKNEITAVR